mmetsp:Transcript_10290/g.26135  ORF Transcript_10290/g.26135 Transcript_10290/m.26135 type:complete len:786 (+) Transcript_10290:111-2468(+)
MASRHPAPHTWETLPNLGDVYSPRTGHAVVSCENQAFYLFGGTDGIARQSDVHAYNVETNLWQLLRTNGTPPCARSGAQAVVWEGSVWLFGGYTKKDGEYFNDVYRFDIQKSTWCYMHTLGEPPNKRTDHSVVLYGNSMYAFGGFDGRNRFNDLRELRLDECRWSNITSRPGHPRSRFGHTAVVYSNSMFIFGGWDGHDTLQELYEYSIPSNCWFPLPCRGSPPKPRYRHSAVVCGESMFTFGGVDKAQLRFADLHEFSLTSRSWSAVVVHNAPPSARTFHKTVVHDGCMYILGGFDGRRQNDMHRILLCTDPQQRGAPETTTTSLAAQATRSGAHGSVGDGAEEQAALMPEDFWKWQEVRGQTGTVYSPRTGHAVVVWNNCFYLFGGTDENARQSDIYCFTVSTKRWCLVNPVTGTPPSARSGSKAVVYRDCVFYFGGYTKKDGEYFNDLFQFDIQKSHWTEVKCLSGNPPSVRTDHTCVIHGPSMYVFGGFDGKSRFADLLEYNIDTKVWEEIQGGDNTPMGRFAHSACMYRSSMYIFGGWNGHDTLDDLYEFSTNTNRWFPVPGRGEIPSSRYRHSAVVYGCCMFVFGGVDKRQARFYDLFEFNFDSGSWAKVQTFGDPPSARTFHRAAMYGGMMYIHGGFDGSRRNDMYRIPLVETLPRDEKLRMKRPQASIEAPDEEDGPDFSADDSLQGKLKAQIQELQRRLETEQERNLCKVCYEREINTVLLPCKHRVVCLRCLETPSTADARQQTKQTAAGGSSWQLACCPLCRQPIDQMIQTYTG